MKVMISQPMNGKHDADVKAERKKIIKQFEKMHIEVIDTFFEDEVTGIDRPDIYLLSKSIMAMSQVDAVYFTDDWRSARGCAIEHEICYKYHIKCLYSDFFENKPELCSVMTDPTIIKSNDTIIHHL